MPRGNYLSMQSAMKSPWGRSRWQAEGQLQSVNWPFGGTGASSGIRAPAGLIFKKKQARLTMVSGAGQPMIDRSGYIIEEIGARGVPPTGAKYCAG